MRMLWRYDDRGDRRDRRIRLAPALRVLSRRPPPAVVVVVLRPHRRLESTATTKSAGGPPRRDDDDDDDVPGRRRRRRLGVAVHPRSHLVRPRRAFGRCHLRRRGGRRHLGPRGRRRLRRHLRDDNIQGALREPRRVVLTGRVVLQHLGGDSRGRRRFGEGEYEEGQGGIDDRFEEELERRHDIDAVHDGEYVVCAKKERGRKYEESKKWGGGGRTAAWGGGDQGLEVLNIVTRNFVMVVSHGGESWW